MLKKIRMRSLYASPRGVCQPGQVIELPVDEAKALVDGGYAEDVKAVKSETATVTTLSEKATVDEGRISTVAEGEVTPEPKTGKGRRRKRKGS